MTIFIEKQSPMPASMNEVVYTSNYMRQSGLKIWSVMLREIYQSRELIWRLIKRDFSVRYRQSYLGYLWAIVPPIATVALFAFLASHKVLPVGETVLPYPVYALWGVTIWQLFSACLLSCTNSLVNAGSLVTKINFPKEAIVVAAIGQPLIDFGIRIIPVAFVFHWYHVNLPWPAIFLPFVIIPVVLMALGLGFFLAISNLAFRDIGNVLGVFLMFGVFAAPIMYPPPVTWPFYLINIFNPFSPLLIATHDLLSDGTLGHPDMFIFSCLFSLLLFAVGWRIFHLAMPRVAERG